MTTTPNRRETPNFLQLFAENMTFREPPAVGEIRDEEVFNFLRAIHPNHRQEGTVLEEAKSFKRRVRA